MRSDHPAQANFDALVSAGQMAGAVALVWRDGRVTGEIVSGWRDVESRAPMRRDTIFRIASLTKPVTAAAALTLYDEGRFELDDPITTWAPEFRDMRVLRSPDGPLDDTVPAEREITFGDLFTHRAGDQGGAVQRQLFPVLRHLQHQGALIDGFHRCGQRAAFLRMLTIF